jgi:hypothetical protein
MGTKRTKSKKQNAAQTPLPRKVIAQPKKPKLKVLARQDAGKKPPKTVD